MSQILRVSDELYNRLEAAARQRGFRNVEELLEAWQSNEDEILSRQRAVQRIDELRESLFTRYGEMPDSTALVRKDRDR